RFRAVFGVSRRDEAGLSIVIPHLRDEYGRDDIVRSVVRHYFHPLLDGKLCVVVEDEHGRSVLDQDSIDKEVGRDAELTKLRSLIALARWGIRLGANRQAPRVEAPPAGSAPKWSDKLLSV